MKFWKIKPPKCPAISYAKSNVSIPQRIFPIDLDPSIEVLTLISWTMRASMQHGGRRMWAKTTRFFRKQQKWMVPGRGGFFLYLLRIHENLKSRVVGTSPGSDPRPEPLSKALKKRIGTCKMREKPWQKKLHGFLYLF